MFDLLYNNLIDVQLSSYPGKARAEFPSFTP
jgi:hypothetical protein